VCVVERYNFQVQGTGVAPSITSVSPNPVPGSNSSQTLTIYGSNFVSVDGDLAGSDQRGHVYEVDDLRPTAAGCRSASNFTTATSTWSARWSSRGASSNTYSFPGAGYGR